MKPLDLDLSSSDLIHGFLFSAATDQVGGDYVSIFFGRQAGGGVIVRRRNFAKCLAGVAADAGTANGIGLAGRYI
jgi:hypothetical protein